MDQSQAISKIKQCACLGKYKTRAEQLIKNPTLVNQGAFGVCGMASIVHVLLKYKLEEFVKLFNAVFRKVPFQTKDMGKIKTAGILKEVQAEYKTKYTKKAAKAHAAYVSGWDSNGETDFLLSRAIAHLLENLEGCGGIVEMQREFSREFKGWDESQGDLAITEECVDVMIMELFNADNMKQIQPYTKVEKAVKEINDFFKKHKKVFVFAGVNGAKILVKGNKVTQPFKRTKTPLFTHWIVIRGEINSSGGFYKIPFWTWTKNYQVEISKAVAGSYFHVFILGTL